MRAWAGSILIAVVGAFALASGCGNPDVVNQGNQFTADACVGGEAVRCESVATGGGLSFGDGGATTMSCPSSCEQLNANCGFVTDKACNGVIQCGKTCPTGQVCGGDGPSRCGAGTSIPDGGTVCTPSTCAQLNADCGFVTDTNCSGTVQCGSCKGGTTCGLGGPNKCGVGEGGACVVDPTTTCAGRGYTCGQAADNCGNPLDCGPATCPDAGQSCIQGVCTTPTCIVDPATTCAGRGFTCGQAADNCGHLLDCGPSTCATPGWTCGGGSDKNGVAIPGAVWLYWGVQPDSGLHRFPDRPDDFADWQGVRSGGQQSALSRARLCSEQPR